MPPYALHCPSVQKCRARGAHHEARSCHALPQAGPSGAQWQPGYVLLPVLARVFFWAYCQHCAWAQTAKGGGEGSPGALQPSEVILTWHRLGSATAAPGDNDPTSRYPGETQHPAKLAAQAPLSATPWTIRPSRHAGNNGTRRAAGRPAAGKGQLSASLLICVMATAEPPLSDPGRHHSPRPSPGFRDPTEATHQHVILTPAEYR